MDFSSTLPLANRNSGFSESSVRSPENIASGSILLDTSMKRSCCEAWSGSRVMVSMEPPDGSKMLSTVFSGNISFMLPGRSTSLSGSSVLRGDTPRAASGLKSSGIIVTLPCACSMGPFAASATWSLIGAPIKSANGSLLTLERGVCAIGDAMGAKLKGSACCGFSGWFMPPAPGMESGAAGMEARPAGTGAPSRSSKGPFIAAAGLKDSMTCVAMTGAGVGAWGWTSARGSTLAVLAIPTMGPAASEGVGVKGCGATAAATDGVTSAATGVATCGADGAKF